VAQLQANFLINTKIKKLYEGTCNISISKFYVEKRAGVDSWTTDFNCSEKGVFEAINSFDFGGERTGSKFQSGKIGEAVEDWDVGQGEETIVKFESDPTDAIVLVDGRIVCQKTPCSKMLTRGKHNIVIQKENYLPKKNVFDIKKGQSIKAKLEPDFGWLTVNAPVEIEIILDGQKIGKTPVNKRVINPGGHQVETENECYYKTGEKFQIKRGETKNITLDLKPKESAIKVTAKDEKDNDIESAVFVDGKRVGSSPGTFKIPLCSKEVVVKSQKNEFKQNLILKEKEISIVTAFIKTQPVAYHEKASGQYSSALKWSLGQAVSGLKWSLKAPNKMNWSNANKYCANLKEDGYSDWRLPTISELRTLIQNCPATESGGECGVTDSCLSLKNCRNDDCDNGCEVDPTEELGKYSVFEDTDLFWSSSNLSDVLNAKWIVHFFRGRIRFNNEYSKNSVRCIR
jgi:hypothetical protein